MGSLEHEAVAAAQFRAAELARRTVEYHSSREAEHRARDRLGGRFTPYPWADAAAAVLADEVLEDEELVVALIRELGRQGCSEVALAALDLVLSRGAAGGAGAGPGAAGGAGPGPGGLPPSKALFDSALLVCAAEYQDERCVALFHRMQLAGVEVDVGSLNLALTGLCCRGRLEEAMQLLQDARQDSGGALTPNSFTVLMILQACNYKRRGAYREAINAVRALEVSGRPANEEVVEALLCVCEAAMHKAPSFEAAVEVFSALAELQLADSTRVYNGLLGAAGRAGRWREAQALYVAMQADDIPASLETHTALIQACVVGRALDHALDIFEFLVAGRAAHELVPASITTYNHLIHACHQAGMLEKALEIAAWVQKTGVEFDDETYEELMATIEVAQLWDEKAMKQALKRHPAVLPKHLRPAPYDAMRVLYLDHLETLQQEELLALEKLGTLGSWAPKSLTKGLMGEQHEQMMREQQQAAAAAAAAGAGGNWAASAEVSSWRGPGAGGLDAEASTASAGGPQLSYRDMATAMRASMPALAFGGGAAAAIAAVSGGGLGGESSASSLAGGGGGPAAGGPPAAGPSMRQLLTSMSMKRIAGAGQGGPGAGSAATALSFRAPGMRSVLGATGTAAVPDSPTASSAAASASSPVGAAAAAGPQQQGAAGGGSDSAPTGFNQPPTWAQVQVADAATAGPGGTPFVTPQAAAVRGSAASTVPPLSLGSGLALAVEPANLLGQPSAGSLGGTPRVSARGAPSARARAVPPPVVAGGAVGTGGLPAVGGAVSVSGLSPLAESSSGVGPGQGSPRGAGGPLPAAPGHRLRALNPSLQVAVGGPVSHDFLPSPLPIMPPTSLGAGSGRRPGGLR
ncbi:hypothetical protein HXX76_014689 [Chlamydomonas incerta]|uniref:Pentacotripeptide-repeat region of PRORP domain-containing protein n=1 Tax=Chlamydomonas incerta TaxID=51695 RepID=A0A835SEN3_CHLIN|nr:hypothetical protein HXX76_014689 [Chlamydomonas incerta]|eukprot:KAG2424156.1 hypothetical protein HXX76_014689 [Chlamydomonas incerta]